LVADWWKTNGIAVGGLAIAALTLIGEQCRDARHVKADERAKRFEVMWQAKATSYVNLTTKVEELRRIAEAGSGSQQDLSENYPRVVAAYEEVLAAGRQVEPLLLTDAEARAWLAFQLKKFQSAQEELHIQGGPDYLDMVAHFDSFHDGLYSRLFRDDYAWLPMHGQFPTPDDKAVKFHSKMGGEPTPTPSP
jgi:hypothetical protein